MHSISEIELMLDKAVEHNRKCSTCNGQGHYQSMLSIVLLGQKNDGTYTCPSCKGSGKAWKIGTIN
jgi:DnaJ-class molecular chaperone